MHGHDEKKIGKLPDFIRYRSGGRVRGNGYPSPHASLMDGVDKGDGIRLHRGEHTGMWDNRGEGRGGRLTCSLDVKAVEGSSCVCDIIHPLMTDRSQFRRVQEKRDVDRTFSGSDTIMWQSMKIPGTPFETLARTGAPEEPGSRSRHVERFGTERSDHPLIYLGRSV
jgi:hypothetical protein